MPASFFAFVTRGPDGLLRVSFPDLPGLLVPPARADAIEAAAANALAAHLRVRQSPLPPPSSLDALCRLYEPDAGYWLGVPVLAAVLPSVARRPAGD